MMLDKTTLIKVVNRDNGTVGYTIPDLGNLHRNFQPKEEKEVTMEELRKLSYLPGGLTLLKDCLVIKNADAIAELLGTVEPEYHYTEEEIKKLLLYGTMDQFMDCLDFAPQGVIDLLRSLAVELQVSDINKREAIKAKTGFDVTKAIEINKATVEEEVAPERTRRATPITAAEPEAPVRRAAAPKYKITSIAE